MTEIGRLTTHVLDTANGHPARGLSIDLFRFHDNSLVPIKHAVTNGDGRVDAPLLSGGEMAAGAYEIVFHVGDYFRDSSGLRSDFLDTVPVRFLIADPEAHYHVPLLVSPYGYSTYRGS